MSDGELSEANAAIIRLKWIEMSDKTLLLAPSISAGQGQPLNSLQRHWPILLGAFIFLLFLLAALLWRRKKKKKRFQQLEDDMDILRPSFSDIESKLGQTDIISVDKILHSQFGIMPTVDLRLIDRATKKESSDDSLVEDRVLMKNTSTDDNIMYQQEEFLGFLEERKRKMGDWVTQDDSSYEMDEEDTDYLKKSQSFSGLGSDMVHLRHIHPTLRARSSDSTIGSSALFAMDDSGRIFDPTLICSICNKSMEGMARKSCACGKDTCHLSAHTLCVLEKYPLPSVSHPGTPPNMLPLCRYRPKA
jgi:hypothetical protein